MVRPAASVNCKYRGDRQSCLNTVLTPVVLYHIDSILFVYNTMNVPIFTIQNAGKIICVSRCHVLCVCSGL